MRAEDHFICDEVDCGEPVVLNGRGYCARHELLKFYA